MRPRCNQLNIVVTCSARKSRPALPGLSVREITPTAFNARLSAWIKNLQASSDMDRVRAGDLYQGDHWSSVRKLISDSLEASLPVQVWIASAGCGLISPQTHIPPYAATFSANVPDSVAESTSQRRSWWDGLGVIRFDNHMPRSLKDLVQSSPSAGLIVAGSPEYLAAMSEDLALASKLMTEPDKLTVLCREGVHLGVLDGAKVHLSAALSSSVGGSLTSLNARMIHWIVKSLGPSFTRSEVGEAIKKLHSTCVPRLTTARIRTTDDQISKFIRDLLSHDRTISGSAALTSFRRAGMAAEQRRFVRLLKSAQREVPLG